LTLFHNVDPTRERRGASETIYEFLARAPGLYWKRVRDVLEKWFASVEAQEELRARFHRGDPERVISAFWELYLHECFFRSGCSLTPHPSLATTTRRPDYLIEGAQGAFYLECVTVSDAARVITSDRRRRQIYDAVERLENQDFLLDLQIELEGETSPSGTVLRRRLDRWLAGLDRRELRKTYERGCYQRLPEERFSVGDWRFRVRAVPRREDLSGTPSTGIGIYPGRTGFSDTRARVTEALEEKARRYGQLDLPFLIAALVTGIFGADDEDLIGALFGQMAVVLSDEGDAPGTVRRPNGLWSASRNGRVSGVITAARLQPWSIHEQDVRLWLNPWAARPLGQELDWLEIVSVDDAGQFLRTAPSRSMTTLFGLPEDWPGPEKPFE
jgi:hypothetical protein